MSKFEFKEYYCKGCPENASKTKSDCQYIGRNGCNCIYENAVDDMRYMKTSLSFAKRERDKLLDDLCSIVENMKFYTEKIEESQKLITEMEIKDEMYGNVGE